MNPGDIIFVRGRSLWSPLIRFFDAGPFTHVAIAVSEDRVLEAQRFTEVRITPLYFNNYEVVPMVFSEEDSHALVAWAISMCGKRYDYTQVLSYALKKLFNTGIWNNPNNVICSELVVEALIRFGRLERSEGVLNLTPNELYKSLKEAQDGKYL